MIFQKIRLTKRKMLLQMRHLLGSSCQLGDRSPSRCQWHRWISLGIWAPNKRCKNQWSHLQFRLCWCRNTLLSGPHYTWFWKNFLKFESKSIKVSLKILQVSKRVIILFSLFRALLKVLCGYSIRVRQWCVFPSQGLYFQFWVYMVSSSSIWALLSS